MKVLLTGATGMVGSLVLRQCLESQDITEVFSLLRRPSGFQNPKLTELVIEDFLALEQEAPHFQGVDVVYYCQGIYTGAVDREKFRQITVDYPEMLAEIIKTKSPDARFCLLSGAGADRSGSSRGWPLPSTKAKSRTYCRIWDWEHSTVSGRATSTR